MRVHDDWTTAAFDAAPVAPCTGPFVRRDLQRLWWQLRAPAGASLRIVEGDAGMLPLLVDGESHRFLGEADLFDYHSPLGEGIPELVAEYFGSGAPGARLVLDSLPWEAMELVRKGLSDVGAAVDVREHESAAVIDLPADPDDYLAGLGKKERHEVRRKGRRFEAELGPGRVVGATGPAALAEFVRLHRAAAGEKGSFMDDHMARFFAGVLESGSARLDALELEGGRAVAMSVGFEDDDAYYLYNSAYDPGAASASPGIVLLHRLIEGAIGRGLARFDFLKGDETYKYRLGAERRPLYVIEGST